MKTPIPTYRFLVALLVLALCLCQAAAAQKPQSPPSPASQGPPEMEGWLTSLSEAVELAEKKDAYIIVDLYAEWCGWCKVLEEKVFTTPRFRKFAEARNFVLLRVDTEDGADGSGLQSRFQAHSLPTTLILTSDFVKVGSISGYAPIDGFLKFIDEQIASWDVITAHFETVVKSDDADLKRDLAQELHARGDGKRAAELYRSVIPQVQPGTEAYAWLHYVTADALRMTRDFAAASDWLKRADRLIAELEKDEGNLRERADLLSFYIAQDNGDCKQAVSSIETFLAAHPGSVLRRNMERTLRTLKDNKACT